MERHSRKGTERRKVEARPGVGSTAGHVLHRVLHDRSTAQQVRAAVGRDRVGPQKDDGTYALIDHKNAAKGITGEGPLAAPLARYLRSIRPAHPSPKQLVHPNPETGKPYGDIGKQWTRFIKIANEPRPKHLPDIAKFDGDRAKFFTFRHSGASHLAALTNNPVLIV